MQWICSKCHYFGKNKNDYSEEEDGLSGLILGTIFLILYIVGYIFFYDIRPGVILLIAGLILLAIGTRKRIRFRTGPICPKCEYKPMLAMDSLEAIKLIKQYDLVPSDTSSKETQKEPNTNSSFKTPDS